MFEALQNYTWAFWVIVAAAALVVEISTSSLVSVWFVPAAVISAVLSLVFHNFIAESISFVILSVLFMVIFRGVYKRYIKEKTESEDDPIVGKTGKAVKTINETEGTVLVGDIYWKAVCESGVIDPEESVRIKSVNGTTVTVEPIKEKATLRGE